MERIVFENGSFRTLGGARFIPNGMHFIRQGPTGHYVFTYPHYSESECRRVLHDFASHGFNVIRVFNGTDFDMYRYFDQYVSALKSFLRLATEAGVYVILETSGYPGPVGDRDERFSLDNARIFDPAFIEGQKQFASRYLSALNDEERTAIMAIELRNEAVAFANQLPFSNQDRAFDYRGSRYDLSTIEGRQGLLDHGITEFANELTSFVHQIDPNWLVGLSVFTPALAGRAFFPDNLTRGGNEETAMQRIPFRALAIANSSVSYVDIHLYVNINVASELSHQLGTAEFEEVRRECEARGKGLLVGEFGIYKANLGINAAASAAIDIARRSADAGFDGHLLWSYDGVNDEHFVAREDDRQILKALTPHSFQKQVGDFGFNGTVHYSDGYYTFPLPHPGLHHMHIGAVGPRPWLGERDLGEFGPVERWVIPRGYFLFSFADPGATPENPPATSTRYFSYGGGHCVGFTSEPHYQRHLAQHPGMPQYGYLTNAHHFLSGFEPWNG